jgi:hypothetical protein
MTDTTDTQLLRNRITQLECTLYLALDALEFDAGDWKPESIERHQREQIALARKHLRNAFDQEAIERLTEQFKRMAESSTTQCEECGTEAKCSPVPLLAGGDRWMCPECRAEVAGHQIMGGES